jgi:hypothetical protein
MKAQTVFTIVAVSLFIIVFALTTAGALHVFYARGLLAIIVAVWIFLALLPYHKEGSK